MPEARDRRETSFNVETLFTHRQPSSIFQDSDLLTTTPAPFRIGLGRFVAQRTPRAARPLHAPGIQNTPPVTVRHGRHRRSSRSVLPSWYPRTPLRDITTIVRAIERRSRLGSDEEFEQTVTPFSPNPLIIFSDSSSITASSTSRAIQKSPKASAIKVRTPYGSKVPKIHIDVTKLQDEDGESELLTPEKKLLNSIDEVEIAVKQELMKLKRTPIAKRVEREKRMRTLMSMR